VADISPVANNGEEAHLMTMIAASAPGAMQRARDTLRAGGIVAIPTETVYGLAVLPDQPGVERLLAAKQRSADKGIQLLVDSVEQARAVTTMPDVAERLAAAFWPGPLTLVLPRRSDATLPVQLGGGRPTLGIRLPDHDVPRRLARELGPLAASSANISGQPDATTAELVLASLGEVVTLVLDDGPVRGGVPSTVVDCTAADGAPRILRVGALSEAQVLAAAG
jgi:L-threonylcarbamoyladenylate synthase